MAHLTYCRDCGYQYRCDKPGKRRTCCFDGDDCHFCNDCPNSDCRSGPVARNTLARLRANPCPECKNKGMITDHVGVQFFCPSGCEASRLLEREQDAFLRFVPQQEG